MRVILSRCTGGQLHASSTLPPGKTARAGVDSFEEEGSLPPPIDQLSRCIDYTLLAHLNAGVFKI